MYQLFGQNVAQSLKVSNTSASKKLQQFVVAIMLLDLLVSEGQCSTFVIAFGLALTNNPHYTHNHTCIQKYH